MSTKHLQVSADKKLKKAALDNALVALADPSKAAKVDPVSQVFAQYWKQKAVDTEKNKNKVRVFFLCVCVCSERTLLFHFFSFFFFHFFPRLFFSTRFSPLGSFSSAC